MLFHNGAAVSHGKEHSVEHTKGQGLLIIQLCESGCVGGLCAVLACANCLYECAVMVLSGILDPFCVELPR